MSDCKTYPADTVDISGNVWETVGENIRNGLFGENVKVGYVNIDKGKITSTDFIISTIDSAHFRINNIQCFLAFTENITNGNLNISFINYATDDGERYSVIGNNNHFTRVIATIKIIYKDFE